MDPSKKNILITGIPGIGKTTLIKRVVKQIKHRHPAGFYTAEIREKGIRKGFELISLDGRKGILSHVAVKSPVKVGKYGVDVAGFEDFLDHIPFLDPATDLVIIDEIGKMECFSSKFRACLRQVMNSEKPMIATISLKGSGIIAEIKERQDIKLFQMTRPKRDGLLPEILKMAIDTEIAPF